MGTRHWPDDAVEAYEKLEQQLSAKNALLKSFRDDVLFRIGSASPYRVVAQAYQDKIAALNKELRK